MDVQGKELELKDHTDSVDGVSWSPTHPDLLATASADKTVRVWDLRGTSIYISCDWLSCINSDYIFCNCFAFASSAKKPCCPNSRGDFEYRLQPGWKPALD